MTSGLLPFNAPSHDTSLRYLPRRRKRAYESHRLSALAARRRQRVKPRLNGGNALNLNHSYQLTLNAGNSPEISLLRGQRAKFSR